MLKKATYTQYIEKAQKKELQAADTCAGLPLVSVSLSINEIIILDLICFVSVARLL